MAINDMTVETIRRLLFISMLLVASADVLLVDADRRGLQSAVAPAARKMLQVVNDCSCTHSRNTCCFYEHGNYEGCAYGPYRVGYTSNIGSHANDKFSSMRCGDGVYAQIQEHGTYAGELRDGPGRVISLVGNVPDFGNLRDGDFHDQVSAVRIRRLESGAVRRARGEQCWESGRADSTKCDAGLTCLRRGWTDAVNSQPASKGQPFGCKDYHCCTPVEEVRPLVREATFFCGAGTPSKADFSYGTNPFVFAEDVLVDGVSFASTSCDQVQSILPLGHCCFTGFKKGGCPEGLVEIDRAYGGDIDLNESNNPGAFTGYVFNLYYSELCQFRSFSD